MNIAHWISNVLLRSINCLFSSIFARVENPALFQSKNGCPNSIYHRTPTSMETSCKVSPASKIQKPKGGGQLP
jgi:hypothetical protein